MNKIEQDEIRRANVEVKQQKEDEEDSDDSVNRLKKNMEKLTGMDPIEAINAAGIVIDEDPSPSADGTKRI